jgi:hypothetical protein
MPDVSARVQPRYMLDSSLSRSMRVSERSQFGTVQKASSSIVSHWLRLLRITFRGGVASLEQLVACI